MNNLNTEKLSPINSLELFGLNEYFSNFVKLYKNNRLPKVILLSGEKGIGKFTLIFHFINYVLSLDSKQLYHFDKLTINQNNNSYKNILHNLEQNFIYIGSAKPNISSIENVRDIKKTFYKSSLNNKPRFTVLDDVELMNVNAANALLKLIEEPSIYDYFFLINNKRQKIIETLSSRSIEFKVFIDKKQKIKIYNLLKDKFDIKNNLFDKNIELTTPGLLLRYSDLYDKLKIKDEGSYEIIILKLFEQYKKKKDNLYLELINFLLEIKFSELIKNNKNKFLELMDIKHKILKLLNHYQKYNLNFNNVINQFKNYLIHAR